jgi:hypothetical protein
MIRGKFENDILEKAIGVFIEKTGLDLVGIAHGNREIIARQHDLIVKNKAGKQTENDIE